MKVTNDGFQSKFVQKHFSATKIDKSEEAKMMVFFRLGFYFALYVIGLKMLGGFLGFFDRLKNYASTV